MGHLISFTINTDTDMTKEQAITILKEHNKWRRGTPPYDVVGNRQPYSPKDIGLAIDCVVENFADGRKIDIDTACEWFIKNWVTYINPTTNTVIPAYDFAQAFRKAMLADVSPQLVNANKELTWHKASEELPKEDTHILFVTKTPYGNAYDVIYYPEPPITDEMDWWMEIPELPKED